ncbi:MAG TPA: DUF4019 domain-containing protein [Rhizomicrobium sp.]|jgi:hypothetical protein
MKLPLAFAAFLLVPIAASAAPNDTREVTDVSTSWLALVDAHDYAKSWEAASALLQGRVAKNLWETEGPTRRDPLGTVQSRNVQDVQFVSSLPGAPDGQYAVIQFKTNFANKANVIETVTLVRENGIWKDAGYFIR